MKIFNHSKKTWFNAKKTTDKAAEIALYNDIGMWGVQTEDFKNALDGLGEIDDLTIRINSYGGEVFVGFAIYNLINDHKAANKTMIVDGVAASIASVIALAGTKRKAHKNSYIMIHNPAVMIAGGSVDLRKAADELDRIKETIITLYRDRGVNLSKKKLDELMTVETWLTAEDALKYGFIDEILDNSENDEPETNSATRLPENLKATFLNQTKPAAPAVNKGGDMLTCPKCGKTHAEGAAFCNHCGAAITASAKSTVERDELLNYERNRIKAISNHCGLLKLPTDFIQSLIDSGETLDQASEKITNKVREMQAATPPATPDVTVAVDETEKFRNHAVNSLAVAVGSEKDPAIKADIRKNPGPVDIHGLVRSCLIKDGMNPATVINMSPTQLADEGLRRAKNSVGSADLPAILADTMNKALVLTPSEVGATFDQVCMEDMTPDFRTKSYTKLSSFSDIGDLPEGAAFEAGGFSDKKESGSVSTKGKVVTLTRRLIVDNDTGVLAQFPRRMSTAVYGRMNRDFYDLLCSNALVGPTLTEDSKALFHADHSNLKTSSGVVSVASLDVAEQYLALQKMPKANAADKDSFVFGGIRQILCGTNQRIAALQVVRSAFDPAKSNNNVYNPYNGIEVISDPYLQSLLTAGSAANTWYGFADKNLFPTATVIYLSGARSPSFRSEASGVGEAQGIAYEISFDYGFTFQDFRGLIQNDGK